MLKYDKFIVFEGLDGSGKTTQMKMLAQMLKSYGAKVCLTAEPTKGPVGGIIRGFLSGGVDLCAETTAMLFAADRYEHVERTILPAIKRGEFVLCDRFYLSSLAYQGVSGNYDRILSYNKAVLDKIKPGVVFFLDAPPEVCFDRITARAGDVERYDGIEALDNIRRRYFDIFRLLWDENISIIDASKDENTVFENVLNALKNIGGTNGE